jgi:hypothetical protein
LFAETLIVEIRIVSQFQTFYLQLIFQIFPLIQKLPIMSFEVINHFQINIEVSIPHWSIDHMNSMTISLNTHFLRSSFSSKLNQIITEQYSFPHHKKSYFRSLINKSVLTEKSFFVGKGYKSSD